MKKSERKKSARKLKKRLQALVPASASDKALVDFYMPGPFSSIEKLYAKQQDAK